MYLYELNFIVSKQFKISSAIKNYLKKQGILTIQQLLEFYPTRYQDRRYLQGFPSKSNEVESIPLTMKGCVTSHEFFLAKGRRTLKVYFTNQEEQKGILICFNRPFLEKILKKGSEFYVYGIFSKAFQEEWSSASFDIERVDSSQYNIKNFFHIFPLYKGQQSPSSSFLGLIDNVFRIYEPSLDNDILASFMKLDSHPSLFKALKAIHKPDNWESLEKARQILVRREIFWLQAEVAYKSHLFSFDKIPRNLPLGLLAQFKKLLPFHLTLDQEKCIQEINKDLSSSKTMNRLLQGDVGSGKTLVALATALPIIEMGFQVAFMAPTEILVHQHYQTFSNYAHSLSFKIKILVGSQSKEERSCIQESIKEGNIQLIIGTHALLADSLTFKNLSYVIIDEQHKFGLTQRKKILEKGSVVDMLLISATPIPRTLALVLLGNMAISTLSTIPDNRKPVKTFLVEAKNRSKVYEFIKKELDLDHQIYFVHPAIKESKTGFVENIEFFLKEIQDYFIDISVSLLHSRLKESEKKKILEEFGQGKIKILVATSLVEVGIDVPQATVMIINYANYFGLASLHQLRGRVGRSSLESYCFLIYSLPLLEEAKERLMMIREFSDGFIVAEKDLFLRGTSSFQDEKQSGRIPFKIANLKRDEDIFWQIQKEVASFFSSPEDHSSQEKHFVYSYIKKKLELLDEFVF